MHRIHLALIATLVLIGCTPSTAVKVETQVPEALVQTLPLTVGVYYDESLRNHRYTENTPERPNWDIDSGAAQVRMFDQVLKSTFSDVIDLSSPPSASNAANVDIVLVPELKEMQFAIPNETFLDFFEAWIRYDIEMMTGSGDVLSNWEIAAYGKSPKTRFGRRTDGINGAVSLALRDAGAKLSTGLPSQSMVLDRLKQR